MRQGVVARRRARPAAWAEGRARRRVRERVGPGLRNRLGRAGGPGPERRDGGSGQYGRASTSSWVMLWSKALSSTTVFFSTFSPATIFFMSAPSCSPKMGLHSTT